MTVPAVLGSLERRIGRSLEGIQPPQRELYKSFVRLTVTLLVTRIVKDIIIFHTFDPLDYEAWGGSLDRIYCHANVGLSRIMCFHDE
jgi:hypothetical protein